MAAKRPYLDGRFTATIGDNAPTDLRMDGFMVTLVYGWHPLIEGAKRLKSGEK